MIANLGVYISPGYASGTDRQISTRLRLQEEASARSAGRHWSIWFPRVSEVQDGVEGLRR